MLVNGFVCYMTIYKIIVPYFKLIKFVSDLLFNAIHELINVNEHGVRYKTAHLVIR